jgi:hypothetical protein
VINDGGLMTLGTEVSHVIYRIPSRRSMGFNTSRHGHPSYDWMRTGGTPMTKRTPAGIITICKWDCPIQKPHMGDCPIYGHYSIAHFWENEG